MPNFKKDTRGFRMKRGNLGKASSDMNKKQSPYEFIGMGISRRLRGRSKYSPGRDLRGKYRYGLATNRRGKLKKLRPGSNIDWDHTLGMVKDFFGDIGAKLNLGKLNIKKPELKGGKRLLPTTIAQRRKSEEFLSKNKGGDSGLTKKKYK